MATSNTTPIVIPQPIAAQATSENINAIPNGATGTNRASFQEGFPAITRMPVIENPLPTQVSGLPPKQQDFNGLFNAVSQHNFFAQNGGLYSFNQAVSDAIGGYPQGALLWAIVGGKPTAVYSLVQNNTFNFLTNPKYLDGVHWAFIDTGLPTGTIITWSTSTAPDGYLICDGSAISRTTYAKLFNVIGTTYGSGNGSTTFNVPNGHTILFGNTNLSVSVVSDNKAITIKGYTTSGEQTVQTFGSSGGGGESPLHALVYTTTIGQSVSYYDTFRSKSALGYGGTGLKTENNFSSIGKKAVFCIKY